MVAWVQYYKSKNYYLPNITEEWDSDFNEDIFNDFGDAIITVRYEVKVDKKAFRN